MRKVAITRKSKTYIRQWKTRIMSVCEDHVSVLLWFSR